MNRINQCLQQFKSKGRKALVGYIVSGDPFLDATLPAMHKLVAEGVDIIELGIPFSDPMADGPVIQLAHERALANNVSLTDTLAVVSEFRKTNSDTPVILMGYANPVERMGYQVFASLAKKSGVDGILTVDLPPEEALGLNIELKQVGIENIFLLAPTTSIERAIKIVEMAGGFLYYVSLKGVTGAGNLDIDSVAAKLAELRELTELPICVGFGIKDAESAAAVGKLAEGVVIGSVLVKQAELLAEKDVDTVVEGMGEVVKPIRAALNSLA
jgi:tryptophan synthase alpha chain